MKKASNFEMFIVDSATVTGYNAHMREQQDSLTIEELAERTDVPVRTVRFYIAEGLLPGPGGRGRAASYGQEHLLRLMLIRKLAEQRLPLREIQSQLEQLSHEQVRALLSEQVRGEETLRQIREGPSPKAYVSALLDRAIATQRPASRGGGGGSASPRERLQSRTPAPIQRAKMDSGERLSQSASTPITEVWQRLVLGPGVELHVREDVLRKQTDLIERLARAAQAEQ